MIEVEKKFRYTEDALKKLLENASFINNKVFTDTYFDDTLYSLTTKDIWFRKRDDHYELKLPLVAVGKNLDASRYRELESEEEIANYFKWNLSEKTLVEWINAAGFVPCATFTTTREKYKRGEFNIDIDTADFGFNLIEIETMIEDEKDMDTAVKKIVDFANDIGLDVSYLRGKIPEFLHRNSPEHLKKLVEAGVVRAV